MLALRCCGCRIGIIAQEEVTQVQVDMAFCGEVHVQVEELRPARRVADRQAGLLLGLAERRVRGNLARIEMAARLQPETEPLVQVEHRAPWSAHDRGAGHVDEVGVTIEGVNQAVELGQETSLGRHLSRRRGIEGGDRLTHCLRQGWMGLRQGRVSLRLGWVRRYEPVPPASRRLISSTRASLRLTSDP